MTSRFESDQGRLVMSGRALQGLARLDSGSAEELDPEVGNELIEAGIVQGGRVHERLAALAGCLSRPSARLIVERMPRPSMRVEGWIDGRVAVLQHLPADATEGDVVVVPRGMAAFRLARLLQLGPRPPHKVASHVQIDAGLLEVVLMAGSSLTAGEVERLLRKGDELEPAWIETLAALSRAEVARWSAGVWWNAAQERPKARTLELLDSEVGIFLVTLAPRGSHPTRRLELRPLTPSQLWRLLCAFVPPETEVSEPLFGGT
ncbi:MAG: hypothetical protein ACLGIB_06075 [Actinomycetota bacterium]